MKKLVFTFSLILNSTLCLAQGWPLNSSKWYVNDYTTVEQALFQSYSSYTIIGDTIVEGHDCKVICDDGMYCYTICDGEASSSLIFIRDTLYPLFDFSKEDGDTIVHAVRFVDSDIDTIIVTQSVVESHIQFIGFDSVYSFIRLVSIDDSLYNNILTTFSPMSFDFVKNVGFINENCFPIPTNSNLTLPSGYSFPFLRCYEDGTLAWSHYLLLEAGYACDYVEPPAGFMGSTRNNEIKIWPNPFHDFIIIHYNQSLYSITVIIRSIDGIEIQKEVVVGDGRISTIHLRPGIYIAEIRDTGGKSNIKLIKK